MASEQVSYNKEDLRGILKAFKAMDAEAVAEAKMASNALDIFYDCGALGSGHFALRSHWRIVHLHCALSLRIGSGHDNLLIIHN